tara:strand:+ start:347 stop:1837 length:1491 start_codon:yes stop_codon:yes gene_type:complete
MTFIPNIEEFKQLAEHYNVIAVRTEFTTDAETPLSAYAKLSGSKPAFLFESVVGGEQVSRYSFVGSSPYKTISCDSNITKVTDDKGEAKHKPTPNDPLKLVEDELSGIRYHGLDEHRFSGGAVGFIGYEYANRIEKTVPLPERNELETPLLFFMLTEVLLIFDHARQTLTVCANARIDGEVNNAYHRACEKIAQTLEILSQPSSLKPTPLLDPDPLVLKSGNFSQADFEKLVEQAKEFVRSGDVIQTVLSQRFAVPFEHPPINLYRAIRAINPSPYMFLMEGDDFAIVGASPEVHVRLIGDEVLIRPIAGTRPRGQDKNEDCKLAEELLADEKEKAEHLMLVDLARNDIGRVCKPGSVRAAEYMTIERYSHVMHIVSQVVGTLRPDENAFDLMRATFPAGTVSGAPKVRAMQIIAEFEKLHRNVYAGALGYFGFEGNHDSCIAIRTAMISKGTLYLQTGAGVVADSVPEKEYQETINKAQGMLKAIAFAEQISKAG